MWAKHLGWDFFTKENSKSNNTTSHDDLGQPLLIISLLTNSIYLPLVNSPLAHHDLVEKTSSIQTWPVDTLEPCLFVDIGDVFWLKKRCSKGQLANPWAS